MRVPEAAERLQVHENTVRAWCRDGKIRAVKPGGDKLGYRIPESEVIRIEAMLAGQIDGVEPNGSPIAEASPTPVNVSETLTTESPKRRRRRRSDEAA